MQDPVQVSYDPQETDYHGSTTEGYQPPLPHGYQPPAPQGYQPSDSTHQSAFHRPVPTTANQPAYPQTTSSPYQHPVPIYPNQIAFEPVSPERYSPSQHTPYHSDTPHTSTFRTPEKPPVSGYRLPVPGSKGNSPNVSYDSNNVTVSKDPKGVVNGVSPASVKIPTTGTKPGIYAGYSTDTLATTQSGTRGLVEEDDYGKQDFTEDENKERGNWSGKLDFLLSCLGYAVGLGNVWRFPYLCYRNGGGAFFIPYVLMIVIVGVPLFFLELSLGQFASNGPLTVWEFAPIFRGVGYAQLIISSMVAIYYNMIIAWSLYYLFACFANLPGLPWDNCDNDWNTPLCSLKIPDVLCEDEGLIKYDNGTCFNQTIPDQNDQIGLWNYSIFHNVTGLSRVIPSEEYYTREVLHLSEGIHNMGPVKWDLTLALIGAWIIAFLCMIKGIKSSGKVVYFTALFPYAVLFILMIRGATLEGALEGVKFYIIPKFDRLGDARVWYDAAVQIFFSLSLASGGLTALSSYNRFHNPVLRDTFIVAIGNCLTSVFAGFIIFSFLGFMAHTLNTSVETVVNSGAGLAFIVYPDAVTRMPISPLWAILFFAMLLTLGLDSQFAMLETVLTSLLDRFSWIRPHKTKVIGAISVVFFLLGLTMCSHGGVYILQLMDTYSGGWAILILGIIECVALSWVYGAARFYQDIELMIGSKPWLWWRICWQGISPALILAIIIFSWVDYNPTKYGDYVFPVWGDALGWLMSFCSIIWVPIVAIYLLCKEDGPFCERLRNLTLPTIEWGPALVKHRKLVTYVEGFVVDPWGKNDPRGTTPAFENLALDLNSEKQSYLSPSGGSIGSFLDTASINRSNGSINQSKSNLSYGAYSNATAMSYESVV